MDITTIKNTKGFVQEFLDEYLSDGLGAKNKREIDILVMNLLLKYGDFAARSNQELSIMLQATESKIKGLRYEARLKYPPAADYVQIEFLYVLTRSQCDFEKNKIVFAIEDNFLRHAIQGRLKSKGMFADSSFNSEIIKIDENSLVAVLEELYGKETAENFHTGFTEMKSQLDDGDIDMVSAFSELMIGLAKDTAKSLALELIKGRLGF
jgi:hypothetical protein